MRWVVVIGVDVLILDLWVLESLSLDIGSFSGWR